MGHALAAEPESKDVFDVIGMTPQEVASAMEKIHPNSVRPRARLMLSASAWVGMPMTDGHRKQFVEELRNKQEGSDMRAIERRSIILDLLEEDGREDEALAFLPGAEILNAAAGEKPMGSFAYSHRYALMRRVGFLIKTGGKKEAAELVGKLRHIEIMMYPWTAVTAVDLAMGRSKQAIDTMEFLLRETAVDAESFFLLARQQIELARSVGGMDAMIADDVPPVLRAVRLDILGRPEETAAVWKAALQQMSSKDMLRMLCLKDFKKTPGFDERVAILLDDSAVDPADKAALITSMEGNERRLGFFFGMKESHDKVIRELKFPSFISLSTGSNNRPDLSAFLARCDGILASYLNEPRFHFLRAACIEPTDPSYRSSLAAVAQSGPSDSQLACDAIARLMPISTADELDRIITQAPSYPELSASERLRRFRAAELDQRVLEQLDGLDFSKPEGDSISAELGSYLSWRSGTHEIPAKVVERVLAILTPLCVGSSEKKETDIRSSVRGWFEMMSRVKVPDETLIKAARDIAAIVEDRKISIEEDMFRSIPPDVRQAAGIEMPTVKSRNMVMERPHWSIAIEMFGHPEVAQGMRSFQTYDMRGVQLTRPGAGDKGVALGLFASSPWRNQAEVAAYAANMAGRDDKALRLAAEVRGLFPDDARRSAVYDSLVATSLLSCADPGVKELAAKHVATIAASPVIENPELIAFLHVVGFGKKDDNSADATRPPDLTLLLAHEKDAIGRALGNCIHYSRSRTFEWPEVKQLIGLLYPPKPDTTPPPPLETKISDYDRLKSLEGAGRGRSKEALDLSREVLDKIVNARKPNLDYTINVAINLLVGAGEFDAYIGQTRERFTREAWPEVDAQRALIHLHSYRIIHPVETAYPYAKRLFELVPTDAEAARIVFEISLKKKDADTVARCLVVIAAQAGRHFCAMLHGDRGGSGLAIEALSLLHGAKATEFISRLIAAPMGGMTKYYDSERESNEPALAVLLHFAVKESPEQIEAVMDWTGLQNSKNESIHMQLAEAMKKAGMSDKALEMLAKRYFSKSSKEAHEPLRFEKRQSQQVPNGRIIPIKDLARIGMLDPLAALAAATEPTDGNRMALSLVRLAARPTMESWKNIVLPALAATPISERDYLRGVCLSAATQVDGSEELRTLIAVEEIRSGKSRDDLISYAESMKLAAALDEAERNEMFPVLWKRAAGFLAAEHPDPNRDGFIQRILEPMISVASDADWKAYLAELRKTPIVVERFAESHGVLPPEAKMDRLRDVAGLIIEMVKPGKPPSGLVQHLIAKLGESGDYDAEVAAFRPLVFNIDMTSRNAENAEINLASSRRLIELVSGDLSAILPVLDVQADERGACQFRWCLTGDGDTKNPSPRDRRFKQFDGRFDIALMAGPERRRLSRVAMQPNAPGVGTGRCKLPPGSKFAALMLTERDGAVVHWTDPVALRKVESWQELPLPDKGVDSRGPFDDTPARDYQLEDEAELILADVPWDEGPIPSFSLWAMGKVQHRGSGSVFIRYVGEEGDMQGKNRSGYSTSRADVTWSQVRQWRKIVLPEERAFPPPGTTRIQLVFRGPDVPRDDRGRVSPGRAWVRFAELKMNLPAMPLPNGVDKLGRVPGWICGADFDGEGKRIALADRDRGVGVFDMDTKTFGGWIHLAEKPAEKGIGTLQLKIMANRIFHIDDEARMRVIDLKKRSIVMLKQDSGMPPEFFERSKMAISQDGSFLAISYPISGYVLFRIDEDGKQASRTFTSGTIWDFAFDEEKKTLLAGEGSRIWTLPLDKWQTAEPQLSAGKVSPPKVKVSAVEGSTGAKLGDRSIHFQKSDSNEWKLISSGKTWASISVPTGQLFQAGNERAWLITPGGSIYQIAFEEIGR